MTNRSLRRRGHGVLGAVLMLSVTGCGAPSVAAPPADPITIGSEAPIAPPIIIWSEAPTKEPNPRGSAGIERITSPVATPKSEGRRAGSGTVLAQLATIPVKGRAPKTGYDRDLFGSGWKDPDRNGCDARNDILARDLTATTAKPGTQSCVILSGVLKDPFTGTTINFVRGQGTSTKVQIDHVVALSDAWQKGAQLMGADERVEFANDPLNLLAVDGPTNVSKGDGDAATWLPPNLSFRCDYVARQTAVKAKYGLWLSQAEHDSIERVVSTECPTQRVPAG